jgi:hypothetical protein
MVPAPVAAVKQKPALARTTPEREGRYLPPFPDELRQIAQAAVQGFLDLFVKL